MMRIECGCGCGQLIEATDARGRARMFAFGHAAGKASLQDDLLKRLRKGEVPLAKLAAGNAASLNSIKIALSKLRRKGLVRRIEHGTWALGRDPAVFARK